MRHAGVVKRLRAGWERQRVLSALARELGAAAQEWAARPAVKSRRPPARPPSPAAHE